MTSTLKLGCIADDYTGATDLANNLVRAGMRVVQTIGMTQQALPPDVDAVVVALKSRTVPPAQATAQALEALSWIKSHGNPQIYFKYCSTFDSIYEGPVRGNIGPVAQALMQALGTDFTVATPAFPDNQRTVFLGHLFVGDSLLSESSMKSHPLTPMRDANLVRVLQAQCSSPVGLIDYRVVAQGAAAVQQRMAELRAQGVALAVVDAICNDDLLRLGPALQNLPLVTGGSGLAIGLPANWGLYPRAAASSLPTATGQQAVVCGSCSAATRQQIQHFKAQGLPTLALDPLHLEDPQAVAQAALAWAAPHLAQGPVLVYSSADPEAVQAVQARLGVQQAGQRVEQALAAVAQALVQAGVGQLVVAGGETSGACVQALGVEMLQIGPQIDPGVPWCHARSAYGPIHLSLKSGNFGSEDFFSKALAALR